ncbi:MAG TPA: epoxyqueuosine reductase QueH, partial [Spirochaetota bacterium]|nr:epoxyqueuosine reductase QueH [Spirochaetota bacterium]
CRECFRIRLEETFREAQRKHIGIVATVLSISPHKDSSMINEIGNDLSEQYGILFLEADFKKKDGFKKSLEISREYGFYRQSYCGCVYSRHEMYRSRNKI